MSGDLVEYATHFQVGRRVRVEVPLADGGTFREWGVVCSLVGDLLELELSRDALPQQASLELGRRVGLGLIEGERCLRCGGLVSGWSERHCLVLRLMDDIMPYEPREFFRQDVCIPLEYRLPDSQLAQEIKEHWRQCRWAMEFAAQEPESGEAVELSALRDEIHMRLERRKQVPPIPVNVSGGGMRLNMRERLRPGMLVELGIYLPQPQRVLEIVGEVVQVTPCTEKDCFNTALRYRFIDEADRDRLIGYLSALQLWELSQQAPKGGETAPVRKPILSPLRLALVVLIITVFIGFQVVSILTGRERGEKHEIEKVFEAGILDLLRQRQ